MLLIPAIDLRGGRCVRLHRGEFAAETAYELQPLDLLQRYRDAGACWLHLVDLDGARDGRGANRAIIAELAALAGQGGQGGVALQVGGGVRRLEVAQELLRLGVARVVIGSAAVSAPDEVGAWLAELGAERVCLAFDVRHDQAGTPLLRTHGWQRATAWSLWQAVERFLAAGLRHVLCTDIERDGTLNGPNLELYQQAVARFPQLRWQASGGVGGAADLRALAAAGAAAAVVGKALLEQRLSLPELQPFLRDA
jgi:phosphoribosylformimino-5-aminoimidazole carboxamide ribotide isomerase